MKTETRVYAALETDDVHEISNEDFMDEAEEQGNVWTLLGFQNLLNCEGQGHLDFHKLKTYNPLKNF